MSVYGTLNDVVVVVEHVGGAIGATSGLEPSYEWYAVLHAIINR